MTAQPSAALALAVSLAAFGSAGLAAAEPAGSELGERIYRLGLGENGPVEATVLGDLRVRGEQFACANCHLRSGLGAAEGDVITPSITAPALFAPLPRGIPWRDPSAAERSDARWSKPPPWLDAAMLRPAYDADTLARAIETGVDPNGRALRDSMPRFRLSPRERSALGAYLARLSDRPAPGVSDEEIRVATVIAGAVEPARRAAMLGTLQAAIDARNRDPRSETKRGRSGPYFHRRMYAPYRRVRLDVWELSGPPTSWRAQLESRLRAAPVFALVGGISQEGWAPIHAFSEAHAIPSLFPVTDLPELGAPGWYTRYASKGAAFAGEAAAALLGRDAGARTTLQLVAADPRARAAADAFTRGWQPRPGRALETHDLAQLGRAEALALGARADIVVLWASDDSEHLLEALARDRDGEARRVLVSLDLFGGDTARIPEGARHATRVLSSFARAEDKGAVRVGFERWLALHGLPADEPRIRGEVFTASALFSTALDEIGRHYYRDALIERVDMLPDVEVGSPAYSRLSFGPGQRFALKGCWLARVGPGREAKLELLEWLVP